MTTGLRTRDAYGRWLPGKSGNPDGRLPRQTEAEYLDVVMAEVSVEKWGEVIKIALEDALDRDKTDHVRARAREWLAKYLIGEPSQLHQMLYKEERKFEIIVRFGDDEPKRLTETIDVEPVIIDDAS